MLVQATQDSCILGLSLGYCDDVVDRFWYVYLLDI